MLLLREEDEGSRLLVLFSFLVDEPLSGRFEVPGRLEELFSGRFDVPGRLEELFPGRADVFGRIVIDPKSERRFV